MGNVTRDLPTGLGCEAAHDWNDYRTVHFAATPAHFLTRMAVMAKCGATLL
jgi:hypothetical protein